MQCYSRQQCLPEPMYRYPWQLLLLLQRQRGGRLALKIQCVVGRIFDKLISLATVHIYLLLHSIEFFGFFRNLSLGSLGSLCTLRLSFLSSLLLGLELLQSLLFRLHLSSLLRSGGLCLCLLLRLNLALFLCKFLGLLGGLLGLPFCNLLLFLGLLSI